MAVSNSYNREVHERKYTKHDREGGSAAAQQMGCRGQWDGRKHGLVVRHARLTSSACVSRRFLKVIIHVVL